VWIMYFDFVLELSTVEEYLVGGFCLQTNEGEWRWVYTKERTPSITNRHTRTRHQPPLRHHT
jgi:hypothetical protein